MATRLISVVFDAADPRRLARFWAQALGWRMTHDEPDEVVVESEPGGAAWGDGGTPELVFVPVEDPKTGKNRVHLDVASASDREQQEAVERFLALGARRTDIGQGDVPWVVLADPEGNELCILEPRDVPAAGRGVAAVVVDCESPERLAPFWAETTGWAAVTSTPGLVALQDRHGAAARLELLAVPEPKQGKNRLHVDVAPRPGDALDDEVARLESHGARRIDIGQGDATWVVLADPADNEFCVLTPQ